MNAMNPLMELEVLSMSALGGAATNEQTDYSPKIAKSSVSSAISQIALAG